MGKTDLLTIIVKNIGLGVADTLSAGMGSAIKNSFAEIPEQIKKTNDALYYMQVKTFLETADLDQEQVTEFLNINPDNLRLGLEVLKILESTYLEEQALYLAKAFRKFVLAEITRERLDQYFHVIGQLNNHISFELKNDLTKCTKDFTKFLDIPNCTKNQPLQTIGFIAEELFMPELGKVSQRKFKPSFKYKRTELYENFFNDILKQEVCTE